MPRLYKVRGLDLTTLQAWDEHVGTVYECKALVETLRVKRGHWKTNPQVFAVVYMKESDR